MTEIQFIGISCNLACAILGPAWLEYPVCVAGGCVRAGDLPLWGTIVGSAIAVSINILMTLNKRLNVRYAATPRWQMWGTLALINGVAVAWFCARHKVAPVLLPLILFDFIFRVCGFLGVGISRILVFSAGHAPDRRIALHDGHRLAHAGTTR